VYVTVVARAFAGIESVQLLVPLAVSDFPPDSEALAPQLVDTVTFPPADESTDGLTEIEQVPLVVPACVQLTLMLPLPSDVAVKLALVQESVAPMDGTGTANPADATAAASTRLMERFVYID
jgi:hypothetical protein